MFLKRIHSSAVSNQEAIPEMVGKLSRFQIPSYELWAKNEQSITGRRASDLFDYLRARTEERIPDHKEINRLVVALTGRGYAGIT
jgi:hypothetical protein